MINFRFHIVSLIAIFLALALGVVIGAGVIDRGVVDALDSRLNTVEAKSDRIKSENDRLSAENQQLSGAIGDLQPFSVTGRLLSDSVGLVAARGVEADEIKGVAKAVQDAGATATGTLWLESKWKLDASGDVKALQTALASTTKNKTTLRAEGFRRLAERLSTAPADVGDPSTDVLNRLQQAGFVGFDSAGSGGIADFPGGDAGLIVVVGSKATVPADSLVVPLATAVHAASLPLVVADDYVATNDGPGRADALQPLRDSDLARTVSTVDDLDLPQGPATVVLALADLFRTPPTAGHYGYGPDAQPLPDPVAP
ncbi:MAG: copper transporter [Acidimicrobiia bacterium]